eukprot:UN10802
MGENSSKNDHVMTITILSREQLSNLRNKNEYCQQQQQKRNCHAYVYNAFTIYYIFWVVGVFGSMGKELGEDGSGVLYEKKKRVWKKEKIQKKQ